jgi:2-polyprenyl-6-methoxyphenol hydroxylase-like FAD-dependent oxidoreductase
MAGLTVARVLSDHFERVTIVERNRFPDEPEIRSGVPQGFQVHLLLARGRELLGELFPELDGRLAAAGCPEVDLLEGWRLDFAAGSLPKCKSDCPVRGVSRILLEHEVRRLTAALPNISIVENMEVTGLAPASDRQSVVGVTMKPPRAEQGEATRLDASLVVDASGRNSKAPAWLEAMGFDRPKTLCVDGHLSYSTRWYTGVSLPERCPQGLLIGSRAPGVPRAGGLMRVERDRFMAVLVNIGADPAPTDPDEYSRFAQSLTSQDLYHALRDATPLGPARAYQRTENEWRDYAALARMPEGFVPIGDAVCSFNPFYGQGMTVAALEAMALGREVTRGLEGLAKRAQRRFRKTVAAAWQLATSEDYRWPMTDGPPMGLATRFGQAYTDQVAEVATKNPKVAKTFVQVIHMKRPATALFAPHVLAPVLARVLSNQRATQSRGAPAAATQSTSVVDLTRR